jgi:redox-sensitive bicupin YhaK (pirin superfamily)
MEIVSIVLSGELEHRDSMGNATVIGPGEVQRMSAGTGVTHSEHNRSSKDPVHFLQIWIVPQSKGLTPSYDQKSFLGAFKNNVKLVKVASGQPSATAVLIHQDLNLWMGQLFRGDVIQNPVPKNRKTWIQVTRGGLELPQANMVLSAGDGLAIDGEREGLEIHGASSEEAEFLVFDLP